MKFIFMATLIIFCNQTLAANISKYEACYNKTSSKIPTQAEKKFLDSYIKYLKYGSKKNGEYAIQKMQQIDRKYEGKFSVYWVSLFEGSIELCCGPDNSCSHSFGTASRIGLYPRIEKGWVTAIYLVLMYDRLASSDGADKGGLIEYMTLIKNKHPWAIHLFNKKYPIKK